MFHYLVPPCGCLRKLYADLTEKEEERLKPYQIKSNQNKTKGPTHQDAENSAREEGLAKLKSFRPRSFISN
jgi:hypothetical protein